MIWENKTLNIQSVIPLDGERKFMKIVAIEEQP
jgi:head-tail adaptor